MKFQILLAIILTIGFIQPLSARLGETPEACVQRYGPKLRADSSVARKFWDAEQRHEKNGIRILIRFLRDNEGGLQAAYLEYQPVNLSDFRFTNDKIKPLLENISPTWTTLTPLPLPPPLTNAAPETIKTMARSAKTKSKVITMEQTGGIEELRQKKEAAARKTLIDSIEARNREINGLKDKLGKTTRTGLTYWQAPNAYAANNDSSLFIVSDSYLKAYDKYVADTAAALQGM